MVSGRAEPVTIGRLVSQCADAMRIACGLPSRLPSAAHASPAGPASRACIGEPWEMKTLGSGITMPRSVRALRFLRQEAFGLHRLLHLRPRRDALVERLDVGPLREIDLRRLRPIAEHEEICVRDGELFAHEVILARELLVEPVE